MRQAHHTPFAANLLVASQRKATETPPFLSLTKHRFRDDLASGVQLTPWLATHFGRQALLGGFGRLWCLWRRAMVRHTTGRYVRVKTHLLQCLGGGLTLIPVVHRRPDRLSLPPLIRWPLHTCLLKRLQGRLGHRCRLLLVVRFIRHVTGQDDLIRLIHTGLCITTVIPTFVVRPHDVELGISEAHLRFVRRRFIHWPGLSTSTFLTLALALSLSLGPTLQLFIGLPLGLLLQATHRFFNLRQALLATRQLCGEFIAATAPSGRFFGLVLPVCRRHQRLDRFAKTVHFLLHIPVAHRLVTRRIALDFRPIRRHVPQLHQPRRAR